MQTLLQPPSHLHASLDASLDKNQTLELLLRLGVGKGEGLPGQQEKSAVVCVASGAQRGVS